MDRGSHNQGFKLLKCFNSKLLSPFCAKCMAMLFGVMGRFADGENLGIHLILVAVVQKSTEAT
jgi:hypothetical protein